MPSHRISEIINDTHIIISVVSMHISYCRPYRDWVPLTESSDGGAGRAWLLHIQVQLKMFMFATIKNLVPSPDTQLQSLPPQATTPPPNTTVLDDHAEIDLMAGQSLL
jgi:hypothetical protein